MSVSPENIRIAIATILDKRGGRCPEDSLTTEVLVNLVGERGYTSVDIMRVRAEVSYMEGRYLDTERDSYGQRLIRLKDEGRREYLGTRKEKVKYAVTKFLSIHGFDLFKWLASSATLGGVYAFVRWALGQH